jgi:hypothetical protein
VLPRSSTPQSSLPMSNIPVVMPSSQYPLGNTPPQHHHQQHFKTPLQANVNSSPTTVIMSERPTESRSVVGRTNLESQLTGYSPTPVHRVKSFTTLVSEASSGHPAMGVFVSQSAQPLQIGSENNSLTPVDKAENNLEPPPVKAKQKIQRPPKVTPEMSSAMSQFQVVLNSNDRKRSVSNPIMAVGPQPQKLQTQRQLSVSSQVQAKVTAPSAQFLKAGTHFTTSQVKSVMSEDSDLALGSPLNILPSGMGGTPSSNEMTFEDLVDREAVENSGKEAPALSRFQAFDEDLFEGGNHAWDEVSKIGDSIRWDAMEEASLLVENE